MACRSHYKTQVHQHVVVGSAVAPPKRTRHDFVQRQFARRQLSRDIGPLYSGHGRSPTVCRTSRQSRNRSRQLVPGQLSRIHGERIKRRRNDTLQLLRPQLPQGRQGVPPPLVTLDQDPCLCSDPKCSSPDTSWVKTCSSLKPAIESPIMNTR